MQFYEEEKYLFEGKIYHIIKTYKLNYRDTQDEKQNFMKHDNILYKIGIEYNF